MMNRTNGPVNQQETGPLHPLDLDVLEACQEATLRRRELLPWLARALNVPENEVFYTWALRKCRQRGRVEGTDWAYFFHGLECNLYNTTDGRFLRIDFGPHGTVDTFTMWGVLQFIMSSVDPWVAFPQLKQHLAKVGPPFDEVSGSAEKMSAIWDRLQAGGVFEQADQRLVDFEARYTTVGPDGLRYVRLPPGTSEETRLDCAVAHRTRISSHGHRILEMHRSMT